ncbi:MAG TPA: tetratricopeptide repeat protein [Pyrinomonadaceae bacterium]|nr:tetratricopeptide repeat protein [Pyrinomonadaceae bacterium]
MKFSQPLFRLSIAFLFFLAVVCSDLAFAQRRGKSPRASTSRAAGIVEEADKLADDKKWPEAIDAYKLAIRLDANYAPAHSGLGGAYMNMGNWKEALAAYNEQVRVAPNNAQAQYDLGFFYNAMGRHGDAFAPLVKAVALDGNFAEAHYEIGYAYLRIDDFEKSLPYLRNALRLRPDYGDAYYSLGMAYTRLGKPDLANEQVKKLATIDTRLSRKLEKDMQAPSPAPSNPTVATTSRPEPVVQSAPVTTAPAPQTPRPQTTEPVSRQLQQIEEKQPPAATPVVSGPAANALSQVEQVKTLPVGSKRWALVIGVDKYQDPQISPLKGSDNDARLIADALVRYAGFPQDQVILLATNQPMERQPTRVNILRRLSNLSTAVPKDGLLLVSFAGHGMERAGHAFLLPSDAQISDQISFLEETAISINRVKERIKETGVAQVVVMLDACRNDPGGRADAPNQLSAAYTNVFNFDVRNREVQAFATIYATGIGQRAYEYTEKKQGYFSWAMVEALKGGAANDKGEITLSQLVKYVQENVPKRIAIDLGSTKQQRPFAVIEGYRADELVMAVTNNASNVAETTPNVAIVDPAALELAFWDTIKNSNNPEDFKSYLEKYPDGQFSGLAKSRAQANRPASNPGYADSGSVEMAYWNAIKDSKNPADFRAYTTKFPGGLFVELANSRISSLEKEARENERKQLEAANDERLRNTRLFDVKHSDGTDGTLTIAPGAIGFEVRKRSEKNDRKNIIFQCSEIKRVEAGKSAFQPPHVNFYLVPGADGKDRKISYFTSSGGQGLFVNKPIVDVTADVINATITNCRMARIN